MDHLSGADQFEANNIQLRSLTEAIDTSTSGGRFFFHMICALAQFERDLISERTKEGMRAAKARGVKIGRPRKARVSLHPVRGS
jgi:DNA invertase Pin-like site-specific DNA recombinase